MKKWWRWRELFSPERASLKLACARKRDTRLDSRDDTQKPRTSLEKRTRLDDEMVEVAGVEPACD